jgi:glycosyltransferase involved in cell wall biosynthesis
MTDKEKALQFTGFRVVALDCYVPKPITGGEIYNSQVIHSLIDNGSSIRPLYIPGRKEKHLVTLHSLLTPFLWLSGLLSPYNKAIIAVDSFLAPLLFLPLIVIRLFTPAKIIVFNHTIRIHLKANWLKRVISWVSETLLLRTGHIIFTNSKWTYEHMGMEKINRKVYLLPPPITVKPKFVDRKTRRSIIINILFVGYVNERKGLHLLIDSLALCRDFEWHLRIAGEESYSPQYASLCRQMVKEMNLSDKVEFLGHLSSDSLEKELTNADIFVLPSRNESYGMVYIEAAAYALPIISTVTGVVGEVLIPGESVYTVPFDDVNALAEAIRKLSKDKALRIRLGENAYKRIDYNYGIEAMYKRASEILLKALLKGRTMGAPSN